MDKIVCKAEWGQVPELTREALFGTKNLSVQLASTGMFKFMPEMAKHIKHIKVLNQESAAPFMRTSIFKQIIESDSDGVTESERNEELYGQMQKQYRGIL